MQNIIFSGLAFMRVVCGLVGLAGVCASAGFAQTIAVTSAASFESRLAPDSLGTVFGAQLTNATLTGGDTDPATPGIQLPTTLGGVSVTLGGRAAGLLFVSPGQVNFYAPPEVAVGPANVVVNTNSGARMSTINVTPTAPGVFTFSGNGLGVVAGVALRVRNNASAFEAIADVDGASFVPRPIDLGPASEQVFLVLFGTGWRRAGANVRVLLGGVELAPQFAGAQGQLLGLDQINFLIPRALLGLGRLALAVTTPGDAPSNSVEFEIGGVTGASAPRVTAFTPDTTQAMQTITINGSGFASDPAANEVRIGGVTAQVLAVTPTQLSVRVPFGGESGRVLVRTAQGDGLSNAALRVRTSLSGVVESSDRQPLNNVTVRSLTSGLQVISTTSATNGAFVLSEFREPQSGSAFVVLDGSRVATTPQFGTLTISQAFLSGRDTQFGNPLTLQQISGASAQVGGGSFTGDGDEPLTLRQPVLQQQGDTHIFLGEVALELPRDAAVRFPDGSTSGAITLTMVDNARLPVRYPTPFWASMVVQITPFGTTFSRGGRLRFPNPENYPAGSRVFICQYDQGERSQTLGQWIAPGMGTVSADGRSIETDAGTILQGAYYFLVAERRLTTVIGRVIDADRAPVRRALVRVRGQETLTDGTGGFIIRNVPVGDRDSLVVEAAFLRPSGRIDRLDGERTASVAGGLTNVGEIKLPDQRINQLPTLVLPGLITVAAGRTSDFLFQAFDFEDQRVPRLSVTGAPFAAIVSSSNPTGAILRLSPAANQTGDFSLTVTATDAQGSSAQRLFLLRVVNGL